MRKGRVGRGEVRKERVGRGEVRRGGVGNGEVRKERWEVGKKRYISTCEPQD